MATADSVKNKIQGLINSANSKTGQNSTNMSDAVAELIAGFGGSGGESTIFSGTYITEERVIENLVFPTPGGASYFAMFMSEKPTTGTGYGFMTAIMACKESARVICSCTNTSGSLATSSSAYTTGAANAYYYGVMFGTDEVTLDAPDSTDTGVRAPQAGKNYVWIAWR